jgi:VanZ family protein
MISLLRKFFRPVNIPAYLVMATITFLSAQRKIGIPMNLIPHQDKVLHFIAFGALGISFCLWIRGRRWQTAPWISGALVVLATAFFGFIDELHQAFVPGRHVSAYDWVADLSGAIAAVCLYTCFRIWARLPRVLQLDK